MALATRGQIISFDEEDEMDNQKIFKELGLVFMIESLWSPEMKDWLVKKEPRFLKKRIEKKDTVFCVGCGTGRNLPLLSSLAKEVIAVEYSERMARASNAVVIQKNLSNVNVRFSDVTKSDPPPCDWAVFLWNTLGDIADAHYSGLLTKLARVTSKGLIISTWKSGLNRIKPKTKTRPGIKLISVEVWSEFQQVEHRIDYYKRCGFEGSVLNSEFPGEMITSYGGFFSYSLDGEWFAQLLRLSGYRPIFHKLNRVGCIWEARKKGEK